MSEPETTTEQEQPTPEAPPRRLSGAQRKKDTRTRIKNPKTGVWELESKWQPHSRVLRGRQSK
jgi:hypothetical protein